MVALKNRLCSSCCDFGVNFCNGIGWFWFWVLTETLPYLGVLDGILILPQVFQIIEALK